MTRSAISVPGSLEAINAIISQSHQVNNTNALRRIEESLRERATGSPKGNRDFTEHVRGILAQAERKRIDIGIQQMIMLEKLTQELASASFAHALPEET